MQVQNSIQVYTCDPASLYSVPAGTPYILTYTPAPPQTSIFELFRDYPESAQIVTAFAFGVVLAPWSFNFYQFLIFLVLYQIVYGLLVGFRAPAWTVLGRIAIIAAGILGWILGHIAIGEDPFSPTGDGGLSDAEIRARTTQRRLRLFRS